MDGASSICQTNFITLPSLKVRLPTVCHEDQCVESSGHCWLVSSVFLGPAMYYLGNTGEKKTLGEALHENSYRSSKYRSSFKDSCKSPETISRTFFLNLLSDIYMLFQSFGQYFLFYFTVASTLYYLAICKTGLYVKLKEILFIYNISLKKKLECKTVKVIYK